MRMVAPIALSLILATNVSVAQAPSADDPMRSAGRVFAQGERAFRAGDYRRAAQAFESAYALLPHEDALWNAARAWHRAGEAEQAANLYARYLREALPGARDRAEATEQLGLLSKKLGRIDVVAPPTAHVRVDETPVAVGGARGERSLYVNPGSHAVYYEYQNREDTQTPTVTAGETVTVAFVDHVATAPPPTTAPPPATKTAPAALPERERPARVPAERHGLPPWVVLVGGGLTAGAGVAALVSGMDTRHMRDEFLASPSEAVLADGRAKQTRTNVLVGVTAGLAVVTAATAIWLVDWRSRGASAHVGVTASGMAVAAGSF